MESEETTPNDWSTFLFDSIDWSKRSAPRLSPKESPWIIPEKESNLSWNQSSFAMKYMNYEVEDGFLDLENPFLIEEYNEIRLKEKKGNKKSQRKKRKTHGEEETICDIDDEIKKKKNKGGNNEENEEEEDFLDDYGNLRDFPESLTIKKKGENVKERKTKTKKQITRTSLLSREDQSLLLNFMTSLKKNPHFFAESSQNDFLLYQNLMILAREEFGEFQSLAKDSFPIGRHFTPLPPLIETHMENYFIEYRNNYVNCLPSRTYDSFAPNPFLRLIPSALPNGTRPEFEMICQQNVLELGIIPGIQLPLFSYTPSGSKCQGSVYSLLKLDADELRTNIPLYKSHNSNVSEDLNALILATDTFADVVISSKALSCIFNNLEPYDNVWEIPLVVKSERIGEKERKILYFNKPYTRSVNTKKAFVKMAGKAFVKRSWTQSSHLEEEEKVLFEGSSDIFKIETFGTCSQVDGNASDEENREQGTQVKDVCLKDLVASQDRLMKKTSSSTTTTVSSPSFKTHQNLLNHSKTPSSSSSSTSNHTSFSLPPYKTNCTYKLWTLRPLLGTATSTLRLLIRSSFHGILKDGEGETLTLSTKLESQWKTFGAEVPSGEELAKSWISTLVKPHSKHVRLRITESSCEVSMAQIQSLTELHREASYHFQPKCLLGNLYSLFSEVKKTCESGNYILQHDEKSGSFVRVFKESDNGTLDMNTLPGPFFERNKGISWTPIDTSVITPQNLFESQVPGLFKGRPSYSTSSKS